MNKENLKKGALGALKYMGTTVAGVVIVAWLKGESLPGLLKLDGLKATLTTGIPLWLPLLLLLAIVALVPSWLRMLRNRPVLHISWHGSAGWGRGGLLGPGGMETVLRIQGEALIALDNLNETVILTAVHLRGAEFVGNFHTFQIEPGVTFNHTMFMNFRGLKPKSDTPLTVRLTFEDNKGRRYPTKKATLRAFPSGAQTFPTNMELPTS
jgi:hypothetical protein